MREILIVDDDDDLRETMANVLSANGFRVQTASNGRDALAQLQAGAPDLLITDVMMPNMDGWELREAMRSHVELSNLPVIVISALEPRGALLEALRPAVAMRKPFALERLLQHVRALVGPAKPGGLRRFGAGK
jgi:DNA-binding response OmpR family regulator